MTKSSVRLLLLYHKERDWADYIREYTVIHRLEADGLVEVEIKSLPQQNSHLSFAQLPERVRRLLFFAKPDLVICMDDGRRPVQPVFALDVTEHVAARDHWIQRFPNLVGCAQEKVPGVFIAPRDMPLREKFRGKTDPFFFFAYDRVIEIHQTPVYIAEWPSTDGANLDADTKHHHLPPHESEGLRRTIAFFDLVLDAAIKGRDFSSLMHERMIVDLRNDLRRIGYAKVPSISDFQRLVTNMPNGRPLTQSEMKAWLNTRKVPLPPRLPDRIIKREKNVIFSPLTERDDIEKRRRELKERIKLRGGDPYTQQPLVFDYLFCRLGPTPFERDANLIIDLTVLRFSDFAKYVRETWVKSPLQYTEYSRVKDQIPIYTLHLGEGLGQVMKNFIRLYAFSADIIVFRDGLLYF